MTSTAAALLQDRLGLTDDELLTDSIRRIFTDDSVSEVFGGENQLF